MCGWGAESPVQIHRTDLYPPVRMSIQTFLYAHWLSVPYRSVVSRLQYLLVPELGYVCPDLPVKPHAKEGCLKLSYSRNGKKNEV